MYAGERDEAIDSNQDRGIGDVVVKKKGRRGPTKAENRPPPTPRYPEVITTREDLRVARMYYEHKQSATKASREEFENMTRPEKVLYFEIVASRKNLERKLGEDKDEDVADRSTFGNFDSKGRYKPMTNLLNKVSRIRTGKNLGSTWTIKEMKKMDEFRRICENFDTLQKGYEDIKPIIERCWSIDREALSMLDLNPWGKDPISYIDELLSSLDHPSPNPVPPPSSLHPPQH